MEKNNGLTYYFGYGTLASPETIEAVIGRKPDGSDLYLDDYGLYIQVWDEIPNQVRQVLGKLWDPNFRSYFVRPAEGKRVLGKLWLITPEERELVSKWEFWYEPIKVKTKSASGSIIEIETEIINNPSIGQVAGGENYTLFLNDKKKTLEAAAKTRETNGR